MFWYVRATPSAVTSCGGSPWMGRPVSRIAPAVTGVFPVTAGAIRFAGRPIQGLPPHEVTALGVARTYQNIRLFRGMSVLDNVLVGTHCRTSAGVVDAMLHTHRASREERESVARAEALLDFFGIRKYEAQLAMNLPYGDQRRLEIARALATRPALILLDEPAAGMNPAESLELIELIRRIRGSASRSCWSSTT